MDASYGDGKLINDTLVDAFASEGFTRSNQTKKVVELCRGNLVVYVKRDVTTRPLVVDPRFLDLADQLRALGGVDIQLPVRAYINSNLRAFPAYVADNRVSDSRYGFAFGVQQDCLKSVLNLLTGHTVVATPEGDVRVVAPESEPLTERERLQSARVGQGPFRTALLMLWNGACPVVGVDHPELLRASHIKSWSVSTNQERLDPYNGILLCAHVDALFDRHMITFDDRGAMLISSAVTAENRQRLGISTDIVVRGFDERHKPYLAFHRSVFRM